MNTLIGIKGTGTEHIRYILLESNQNFDKIAHTLKNFYRTPERTSALIDLGNLLWLGITPYTKSKGEDDLVNCESKVRDRKLSPGKHGSLITTDEKGIVEKLHSRSENLSCCFLFEENNWYVLVGGHKESIQTADETVLSKSKVMDGIKVYCFEPDNKYSQLLEQTFYSWDEVRQSANVNGRTYYIFRNEKLLTIISPVKQENNDIPNPQPDNTTGQEG